jgi:hypothetical protein
MSALIILVVALVWARIGFVLWRWLIRPRIKSPRALYATTLALAGIWLVGPVLDEILGAREFAQACREIPEVKFHGPVAIGTGAFFDEHGKPRIGIKSLTSAKSGRNFVDGQCRFSKADPSTL